MIRWLKPLFLLLGLSCIPLAAAQDATPTPAALPVIDRCVTIENNPPDDWTFAGTIITYRSQDGVHGFRADLDSRYYIAFDGPNQFALDGSLSPDGRWFASYLGYGIYGQMFDYDYYTNEVIVTSVHPRRESYRFPFRDVAVGTYSYFPKFAAPVWLDNTQFVVENTLIRPFEGLVKELTFEEASQMRDAAPEQWDVYHHQYIQALYSVSGDLPPVFAVEMSNAPGSMIYVTDRATNQIYNTCIQVGDQTTSGYAYALSPSGEQIAVSIGSRDNGFVFVFDLNDWTAYRLDLAANPVVAWVADP